MNLDEFLSGIMLFPYLFKYPLGIIVFINGILCHWSCAFNLPFQKTFLYLDIISNFCLVLYVNYYTSWQPWTILLTFMSVENWIINRSQPTFSIFQHAYLVQFPLFVALMHF